MKLFQKKPIDERIVAESNKIYRTGYLIMTFGILLDLYLKLSGFQMSEQGMTVEFPLVEFAVFMAAQIVCCIMMVRKGFISDSHFAETDTFPAKHFGLVSLAAGFGAGAVFTLLRCFMMDMDNTKYLAIIAGITFLSIFVTCSAACFVLYYWTFCAAKKRRAKLAGGETDED